MRIAVVVQDFEKGRGYIENALARHLARAGADVHLITTNLSPDFPQGRAAERGALLRSSELAPGLVEAYDGYTLHVLPHQYVLGFPRLIGLHRLLRSIRPDIVQTKVAIGWIPLEAALVAGAIGFKLFTGNHTLVSSFPLASQHGLRSLLPRAVAFATRWVPGRIASWATARCYAPTIDGAELAWRFFGVERRKVEVMHLGVDTERFHPVRSAADAEERARVRASLGIAADEVVCIYTGKFSKLKNAIVLSEAIAELRRVHGQRFRALCIGQGEQGAQLQSAEWTTVLPLMPHPELAAYYRAADIGVWPTNESISTLDAAASGLPLIISDRVIYRDHVDGNGLVYAMNDRDDLVAKLLTLSDPAVRSRMGTLGAAKMAAKFSWDGVARRRIEHYREALGG